MDMRSNWEKEITLWITYCCVWSGEPSKTDEVAHWKRQGHVGHSCYSLLLFGSQSFGNQLLRLQLPQIEEDLSGRHLPDPMINGWIHQ